MSNEYTNLVDFGFSFSFFADLSSAPSSLAVEAAGAGAVGVSAAAAADAGWTGCEFVVGSCLGTSASDCFDALEIRSSKDVALESSCVCDKPGRGG
jgi:hypothetical protein